MMSGFIIGMGPFTIPLFPTVFDNQTHALISFSYTGLDVELCKLIVERNTVPSEGGVIQSYDANLCYDR